MSTVHDRIEELKQSVEFDEIVAGTVASKLGQKRPSAELVAAIKQRLDPKLVAAIAKILGK